MQEKAQKLKPGLARKGAECAARNAAGLEIAGDRNHVKALLLEKGG